MLFRKKPFADQQDLHEKKLSAIRKAIRDQLNGRKESAKFRLQTQQLSISPPKISNTIKARSNTEFDCLNSFAYIQKYHSVHFTQSKRGSTPYTEYQTKKLRTLLPEPLDNLQIQRKLKPWSLYQRILKIRSDAPNGSKKASVGQTIFQ